MSGRERRLLGRKSTRAPSNVTEELGDQSSNSKDNAMIANKNGCSEITSKQSRVDRVFRRDELRQQNEREDQKISKEEENQIKQAIELSMLCHRETPEPDTNIRKSVVIDNQSEIYEYVNHEDSEQHDEEVNEKDQQMMDSDEDSGPSPNISLIRKEVYKDYESNNDVEDNIPSQEEKKANDKCCSDEDGDSSGRNSPLLFQTPTESDVLSLNMDDNDDDMTQVSSQSSVHSEMDIFAKKDKLSLKKRKRESSETEQPNKTPKFEQQSEEISLLEENSDWTPLPCIDRRPINKITKPFFAPDNEAKNVYTSVILNMLNQQLKRLRNAQQQLSNFSTKPAPIAVGPIVRGCLRYRRRNERPFVFFDSEDESGNESPLQIKTGDYDSKKTYACEHIKPALKRQKCKVVDDDISDSDFETMPKRPRLTEKKKPNFADNDDDDDDDDDDILYAGETLPFCQDDYGNEQLDDKLLNNSPVHVIITESDQETNDCPDLEQSEIGDVPEVLESQHSHISADNFGNESHCEEENSDANKSDNINNSSDKFRLRAENPVSYEEQKLYQLEIKPKRKEGSFESINTRNHLPEDDVIQLQNSSDKNVNYDHNMESDEFESGDPVVVMEVHANQNTPGFFTNKRQIRKDVVENQRILSQESSPGGEIPIEEEHENVDFVKDGIPCPLCNVIFHRDTIERHAAECDGPAEEVEKTEPQVSEVLTFDPESSTASQMERDHEEGWLFSESKKTSHRTKHKTLKNSTDGQFYNISDDSENESVEMSKSSTSDHVEQIVSEMIGEKKLSIIIPKATKRQRPNQNSSRSEKKDEMETCFMCNKLVPMSEYPEHVNAELEQQNHEQSLHIECQHQVHIQTPRYKLRKTVKKNKDDENEEKDENEMEDGDLDELIAFSKENQDDDGDDEYDIDEESDCNSENAAAGEMPFDISDSPIKAFKSIKNTRAGFIDYNNQFKNKQQTKKITEKSLFPSTSNPQTRSGRRKGRGRGNGGKYRKKKINPKY